MLTLRVTLTVNSPTPLMSRLLHSLFPLVFVLMLSGPVRAQLLQPVTLQAESAALTSAPVESSVAGFRGSGYVNFPASGGAATWSAIGGGPGGGVNITIRYALGGSATLEAPLTVNGVAKRVKFAPTGSATTWGTMTAFARVNAGAANTITLATDGADIGLVDEITVSQPAPVKVPTRVYWGGFQNMEQLTGTGASQWTWVQQHQDGLLLHGAYWGNPAESPAPSTVGPALASLLAPFKPHYIYESGMPGEYPRIDTALGTSGAGNATNGTIQDINQLLAWGFSRPDISTDYHMYAWQESMRYHPEWNDEDFFTALCGNWETTTSTLLDPATSDRTTYGWFRQYVEKLALTYPGIRVTATDSPVYFNWDNKLELGDGNNAYEAWVKLERHGANVEAFWSATGASWRSLGQVAATLPSPVLAGLAVTSKNNARLATAAFNSAQVYDFFFQDIGIPGRGGSLAKSGSTFTLTSWGDESTRNGAKDNHFFTYRDWTGDGAFVARVDSLIGSNATRPWPLAGLEIRESLANNARFVSTFVNAANEAHLQSRATAGVNLTNHVTQTAQGSPKWLKLERVGNLFTASRSDDGIVWTAIGTTTLALNSAVKIGLVADSQVYFESVAAQFSNVSFLTTTAMNAAWTGADIGVPGIAGAQTISSPISIDASGTDIGGTSDQFRFVSKPLAGDGTILARCTTFADKTSASTALNALAKMGVMLRSSTAANAQNTAAFFTPQQGIRQLTRATDGATAADGGVWGVGEARIVNDLNGNRRTLAHYLTGNDFFTALRDSFPATYKSNFAGFTTDSPYSGYMKWGGSETFSQAVQHRDKIRLYEAWLQANGTEHQLIANDNTGGATGTQAEKDTWDSTYADNSMRSIQLHQLEGGRPDRVLLESWYSGPFTLVPETKAGSFTNLAMTGIKYLKGDDQTLDLSVKRSAAVLFNGASVQQSVPAGSQVRAWRAATATSAETFTIRLKNEGDVEAFPVLQAFESGATGWTISYTLGGAGVTAAITSPDGVALTDSATRGSELIGPGATVDLTVTITAANPSAARSVLVRAFWNPQDPNLAVKDAVQLDLLPPNVAPTALNGFAATAPGANVDVDLWPLVSDSELANSALWLSVTGATNGTATLLADGHTVHFTPAAGYNGPATFTYSVRDAATDPRLLRSFTFEPPDDTADSLATDAANLADGALVKAGTGSFAYETGAPAAFLALQTKALRLTEISASEHGELQASVPATEYNLSNSSWTASFWFKRATRGTIDTLFYSGIGNGRSGSGNELELIANANADTLTLSYWDAANVRLASLTTPATVPVNTWHHSAIVWTAAGAGSGTIALFLDGVAAGSATFTAAFPQVVPLIFGGTWTDAGDPRNFDGWLDDCALFSAALSTAEIANLAKMPVATNAGLASSATVTINVDDVSSGLLARWPFDGSLADVSGNGWTLTPSGNAAPTTAAKQQGTHSLALDGAGDYARSAAMPLGGAFTVAAWVFIPSSAANIQTVAANSASGNASGFRFYVNRYNTSDGTLMIETANGTVRADVASAAGVVAMDRWQHVAAIINRTAGTATLFRNGTPVATGAIRTDLGNTTQLTLGATAAGAWQFRSNLDDARIYTRLLSTAEIATLVNATNTAPTLSAIANQTITESTSTDALAFTLGDTETAPQHLTLAASSSNTTLIPNANLVLAGTGASRTATVSPAANQLGNATITLTVNDGTLPTSSAFAVTVNAASPSNAWRFQNFATTANTSNAADASDPDKDGLTNLVEYGTGTNPNAPTTAPVASVVAGRLALTFSRNTAATDVTLTVRGAEAAGGPWTDLASSVNGAATVALVGGVSVSETGTGANRTVEVRDLYTTTDPAHPRRFLRLLISR